MSRENTLLSLRQLAGLEKGAILLSLEETALSSSEQILRIVTHALDYQQNLFRYAVNVDGANGIEGKFATGPARTHDLGNNHHLTVAIGERTLAGHTLNVTHRQEDDTSILEHKAIFYTWDIQQGKVAQTQDAVVAALNKTTEALVAARAMPLIAGNVKAIPVTALERTVTWKTPQLVSQVKTLYGEMRLFGKDEQLFCNQIFTVDNGSNQLNVSIGLSHQTNSHDLPLLNIRYIAGDKEGLSSPIAHRLESVQNYTLGKTGRIKSWDHHANGNIIDPNKTRNGWVYSLWDTELLARLQPLDEDFNPQALMTGLAEGKPWPQFVANLGRAIQSPRIS